MTRNELVDYLKGLGFKEDVWYVHFMGYNEPIHGLSRKLSPNVTEQVALYDDHCYIRNLRFSDVRILYENLYVKDGHLKMRRKNDEKGVRG